MGGIDSTYSHEVAKDDGADLPNLSDSFLSAGDQSPVGDRPLRVANERLVRPYPHAKDMLR